MSKSEENEFKKLSIIKETTKLTTDKTALKAQSILTRFFVSDLLSAAANAQQTTTKSTKKNINALAALKFGLLLNFWVNFLKIF